MCPGFGVLCVQNRLLKAKWKIIEKTTKGDY